MARAKLHLAFLGLSLVAFFVATVGFDFIARVAVSQEAMVDAASKSAQWLTSPLAAFLLVLPFIAAGVLGAEFTNAVNLERGRVYFGVVLAILGLLYFSGFWGSQQALQERKWTAASLSVGMNVLLSVPVLLIAGVAGALIVRRPSFPRFS
jgi:hypothetical protein